MLLLRMLERLDLAADVGELVRELALLLSAVDDCTADLLLGAVMAANKADDAATGGGVGSPGWGVDVARMVVTQALSHPWQVHEDDVAEDEPEPRQGVDRAGSGGGGGVGGVGEQADLDAATVGDEDGCVGAGQPIALAGASSPEGDAKPPRGRDSGVPEVTEAPSRVHVLDEQGSDEGSNAEKSSAEERQAATGAATQRGAHVVGKQGWQRRTITPGNKLAIAKGGDLVAVHCTATVSGKEIDSSYRRCGDAEHRTANECGASGPCRPFTWRLPRPAPQAAPPSPHSQAPSPLVRAWEEGIVGMALGEKVKLSCSPECGYGERGALDIVSPDAHLVFELTLVAINGATVPTAAGAPTTDGPRDAVAEAAPAESAPGREQSSLPFKQETGSSAPARVTPPRSDSRFVGPPIFVHLRPDPMPAGRREGVIALSLLLQHSIRPCASLGGGSQNQNEDQNRCVARVRW